jgi:UDP-N-acetylmuramyl pentapeptide phosphotransferase/UDP-N-acetylglucosamine-1-phosphate transferase
MQQIIVGTVVAFFISFYLIPILIELAKSKQLVDIPDARKIHKDPVPRFGGIGIFSGFLFSLLLSTSINNSFLEFQYLVAAFLIVFFLGVGDDIMILSPLKKFIGQLAASFILIVKGHLLINNLHGFLGIHEVPILISYILTYFTIVVIINAINLIDGVDGLAGSLSLISTLFFGCWFYINGDLAYALIAFTLAGSIVAFLYYNFNPAKIFMGDAGSLMLGLINAVLVIRFINAAPTAATLAASASPAVGFGLLLIPLMDTLRVFCIRLYQKRSPFFPDRNHIHHLFLDRGFSSRATTIILASLSFIFSILSFVCSSFNATVLIMLQAVTFFSVVYLLSVYRQERVRVHKSKAGNIIIESTAHKSSFITIFYKRGKTVSAEE